MPRTNNSASDTPISDTNLQDSPPYAVGEKVFASHTNRLYEAKVREVEYGDSSWRFFVHYIGWKKSWDEWVGMDRLMKDTEETKRIKLELDEKFGCDKKAKCDAGALKTSNVARGRKRKNDSVIEGKFDENEVKPIKNEIPPTKFDENEVKPIKNEIKPIKNEIPPTKFDENEVKPIKNEIPPTKFDENEVMPINLEIPPTLWKRLVDDSEFITNLGKLVKLPRTPNVKDIFQKYYDYKLEKDGSVSDTTKGAILGGLGTYFDIYLPGKLLFKKERQQYKAECPNNVAPSTIYGAEHLLRLFVKLPKLLLSVKLPYWAMAEFFQPHFDDFLSFLERNQSEFFLSTYDVPEDTYNNSNSSSSNKQGA